MNENIKEIKYGDILIRRVKNGWLLIEKSEDCDDQLSYWVYQDEEIENWASYSLYKLLSEAFEPYMQSKRSSGIKITYTQKTKEEEDEP
jgi:hypothetical protein